MKLHSPIEEKRARIEIIPLIDIMFFLLACFMAISLSLIQMRGMGVNLPVATNAQPELNKDFVSITVDVNADLYLEKERLEKADLAVRLRKLVAENKEVRIYIRADKDVAHGEVVRVLDLVRSAGAKKVAFEIKAQRVAAPGSETLPPTQPPLTPPVPPVPPVPPAAEPTPRAPLPPQ